MIFTCYKRKYMVYSYQKYNYESSIFTGKEKISVSE